MSILETRGTLVKKIAKELEFSHCGIARAERLDEDARRLESWLLKGHHAGMGYMENHFELRVDPTKLVPGAKSVITLMMNYYPSELQEKGIPKISKYAYGNDYHDIIREKLNQFLFRLRENFGEINGRGFVDSAPVLERTWATKTGLGWVGKNGNLINKEHGSFFFLSTLITDLALPPDDPFARDYCGTCTKCIDNCPTEAIHPNKDIDARRCISYLTIELKDMLIPEEFSGKFEDWMFGCDICQDVCPWNRFAEPQSVPGFSPRSEILHFNFTQWEEMNEDQFKKIFKDSPIKRSKFKGIKRNLQFLLHAKPGKETI
ncbi:MAG: tRNA epoxyqueuosine(34) reductase QueG [Chitinophagaceae bacterium]|nr:tRNA epoxyqueuosine(34) reductase QueG [Chitinophagaceae bacterium]